MTSTEKGFKEDAWVWAFTREVKARKGHFVFPWKLKSLHLCVCCHSTPTGASRLVAGTHLLTIFPEGSRKPSAEGMASRRLEKSNSTEGSTMKHIHNPTSYCPSHPHCGEVWSLLSLPISPHLLVLPGKWPSLSVRSWKLAHFTRHGHCLQGGGWRWPRSQRYTEGQGEDQWPLEPEAQPKKRGAHVLQQPHRGQLID